MAQNAMRLVFCMLPFAGMAAGAADEVVTAIFGRPFLPAGEILAVLIFAALGGCMISINASTIIAAGRPKLTFVLAVPLAVLAAVAHFFLVPPFGPIAAAIATTALAWTGAAASMLAVYRLWSISLPAATCVRSILVCVLAYVVAVLWPAPGLLIVVKLAVVSLLIMIMLRTLGEISTEEIAFVRSLLRWKST